jgi:hypothetical protein
LKHKLTIYFVIQPLVECNRTQLKAKAKEIQLAGNIVPDHMKLPELRDILKMIPPPTPNARGEENDHQDENMTAFTFVVEHLVGAILGKKVWDKYKCCTCFDKIYTIRQSLPVCHLGKLLRAVD